MRPFQQHWQHPVEKRSDEAVGIDDMHEDVLRTVRATTQYLVLRLGIGCCDVLFTAVLCLELLFQGHKRVHSDRLWHARTRRQQVRWGH